MASLSDFERLDIVIRGKNGNYLACMPQINLFAGAESVAASLDKLDKRKQELIAELSAAECLDEFPIAPSQPYLYTGHAPSRVARRNALAFISKTIMIVAALVVGGIFFTHYAAKSMDQMLSHQSAELRERFGRVGGPQFWANLEKQLANAADPKNDLAPAKKEAVLAQLRTIAERYRPFVRELSLLFYDPAEPPKSQ
jgi:hypothetical protein